MLCAAGTRVTKTTACKQFNIRNTIYPYMSMCNCWFLSAYWNTLMHIHGTLNTAACLNFEVCEQLNEERMANCSYEDFLLDVGHVFLWYNLQGKHFFTAAMATWQFHPCQYDLAKCSFAQTFSYLEIFER